MNGATTVPHQRPGFTLNAEIFESAAWTRHFFPQAVQGNRGTSLEDLMCPCREESPALCPVFYKSALGIQNGSSTLKCWALHRRCGLFIRPQRARPTYRAAQTRIMVMLKERKYRPEPGINKTLKAAALTAIQTKEMKSGHTGEEGERAPSTKLIFALYWYLAHLKASWRFKSHFLKWEMIHSPPPMCSNLVHFTENMVTHREGLCGNDFPEWEGKVKQDFSAGTCDIFLPSSSRKSSKFPGDSLGHLFPAMLGSPRVTSSGELLFLLSKV